MKTNHLISEKIKISSSKNNKFPFFEQRYGLFRLFFIGKTGKGNLKHEL